MGKYFFNQHFTLQEANALVPLLRDCLEQIHQKQSELFTQFPELKAMKEKRASDSGFVNSLEYLERSAKINQLIGKMAETGVLLKNLSRGLVDFPHLSEGKEVFLCWELGEREVLFWHEMFAGYAGRQPLYLDKVQ